MANQIQNDKTKAGKRAGHVECFGEFSRYAVYPVHTRFDAVQWFVTDAAQIDKSGLAAVIRQAATRESAVAGLQ